MTDVIGDPRRNEPISVIGAIRSRRRPFVAVAAAVSVSLSLQGCSSATTTDGASSPASSAAGTAAPVEWSYSGDNGPDCWADMVASCQSGPSSSQSPIDLDPSSLVPESPPDAGAVTLHYIPTLFEVENTGHTIEAVPEDLDANSIAIDGTNYYLQQFHLHTPSEHTITDRSFPIEVHLVHNSEDGTTAVLGVPLATGAENAALAELFTKLPTTVTDEQSMVPLDAKIDPTDLIPPGSAIARYSGSLTTPPCTEPVLWSVFLTPATVSAGQVANLQQIFPDNHRPTQPLNGRVINEVREG